MPRNQGNQNSSTYFYGSRLQANLVNDPAQHFRAITMLIIGTVFCLIEEIITLWRS